MQRFRELIDLCVRPLAESILLVSDPTAMPLEKVVEVWVLLKFVAGLIETRQKELREVMLSRAEQFGKSTEKGGQQMRIEGSLVLREKRIASLPPEAAMKALLKQRNIPLEDAFSKVTKTVLDPSKVKVLTDLGKLTDEEVDTLRKVTWALRVKPSHELEDVLDESLRQDEEEMFEGEVREKKSKSDGKRKGE